MEIFQDRFTTDLAKIGIATLAHIAILVNRHGIRSRVNSEMYNNISLHAEHVLHHAMFAMAIDGGYDVMNILRGVPYNLEYTKLATYASWMKGFYWDIMKPVIFPKSKSSLGDPMQIDQMISNTVGCSIYLLPNMLR